MAKGKKPYPYSRAPKTGGMPPMSKPKAKPKAKPRAKPAPRAAAASGPKPNPWFDPKTGRAVRAAETVRKAAAPVARGAAAGAARGSRAGVVGAIVGGVVGAVLPGLNKLQKWAAEADYTPKPGPKGPGRRGAVGSPKPMAAPQTKKAAPPAYSTHGGDGSLSSFGKAFKEAEYNRRKKGGPSTFMWKGKSYLAAQKGRKY